MSQNTKTKKIEIYEGKVEKVFTCGDSCLVLYAQTNEVPNPLENMDHIEVFCFNSNDYCSLIPTDKEQLEQYIDELGDDLFYTFERTIVDYSRTYLYCQVVIKKSSLAKKGITFSSFEEQTKWLDELKTILVHYENWMNGDCYEINYQTPFEKIWAWGYTIDDCFDWFDIDKSQWTEIENPDSHIKKYLEI